MKKSNGIDLEANSRGIFGQMALIPILFTVIMLFGSCNKCDKDCGRCGVLDEDNCECNYDVDCLCKDGKQDGNEEWIDCGGDCVPCACRFDPCEFLTNGSKKTWIFTDIIEQRDYFDELDECDLSWTYTFQVNHVVETGCGVGQHFNYIWTMDDPENPENLILTQPLGAQFGFLVHKLTADSLIIDEKLGTVLYLAVPSGD